MKDLVRVGIANAAEEMGIGQRALNGMIFLFQCLGKFLEGTAEHLQAAWIERAQSILSPKHMERRPLFASCFVQEQTAIWKIKGSEPIFSSQLGRSLAPVQTPRDHQVNDQPQAIFEADGDAFSNAPEAGDVLLVGFRQRW